MKNIFQLLFFGLILFGCSASSENKKEDLSEKPRAENECPKGHLDEVIPVLYGFPTKEMFQKGDSGLVYLSGCELPKNPAKYYCKKHKVEF